MTLTRRLILALALIAGITPAIAQVPPPVPALPDPERRTTYNISGTTCACAVNFALYGDATDFQNWVEVYLNGVRVNYNDPAFSWTISSPTGSLGSIPRPVTDAVLTFTAVQTGTVQIVGAVRPRRTSTFAENRGVAARDLNQVLNYIVASLREVWDKINDVTGRGLFSQPGNTVGPLPLPSACANSYLAFDVTGLNPVCQTATPAQVTITNATGTTGVLGRLTLASGVPVMTPTSCGGGQCVAQQILYFAPDGGMFIPVFDGTTQALKQFTASSSDTVGLALNLAGSGSWPANSCFDVFYANVSGVYYFGTGPAWSVCQGSTVTATASSWSISGTTLTVTTATSGSFAVGGLISNPTGGTGGVAARTFIVQQLSGVAGAAGTYQLSQTSTTAGSGTLTQYGPTARGYSLAKLNGVPVNAATMTLRDTAAHTVSVPANQATLLGTFATDAAAAGKITYQFGTAASAGGATILNVANYWNRKNTSSNTQDNGAQWTSNINPFNKDCHDSTTYRITFVSVLPEDSIGVKLQLNGAFTSSVDPSGLNLVIGPIMDIDAFNTQINYDFYGASVTFSTNATWAPQTITATGDYIPVFGQHFIQCAMAGDAGPIKMSTAGGTNQITNNFTISLRN